MAESFPKSRCESWGKCNLLLSHAEDVISYEQAEDKNRLLCASFLGKMAQYMLERGNLVVRILDQGQWKGAEELQLQVVKTRSNVLGKEHPDTLTSVSNSAMIFGTQGRWKEAEKLHLQVMKTSSILLGEEHPQTLISISNIATTFESQGWWKEVEKLHLQVMKTRSNVGGKEHSYTLNDMDNLAHIYRAHDRNEEAIDLMEKVVKLKVKIVGADHLWTITPMDALDDWTPTWFWICAKKKDSLSHEYSRNQWLEQKFFDKIKLEDKRHDSY